MEISEERLKEIEAMQTGADKGVGSSELLSAAIELLAVAELRGDDELPHPSDDEKLWTARMQDAWGDLREKVESISPDSIYEEVVNSRKHESR